MALKSEEVRAVIGTLAHNRSFTIADVREYTAYDRPEISRNAGKLVRMLRRNGLLHRAGRGRYYPTSKGWAWIEA